MALSITWNTPNFDHTYLAIPNVKSIGSFAKTKEMGFKTQFKNLAGLSEYDT
jgi:hypothetical protein